MAAFGFPGIATNGCFGFSPLAAQGTQETVAYRDSPPKSSR